MLAVLEKRAAPPPPRSVARAREHDRDTSGLRREADRSGRPRGSMLCVIHAADVGAKVPEAALAVHETPCFGDGRSLSRCPGWPACYRCSALAKGNNRNRRERRACAPAWRGRRARRAGRVTAGSSMVSSTWLEPLSGVLARVDCAAGCVLGTAPWCQHGEHRSRRSRKGYGP
jgi:hypothetical protein